VCKSPKKPPPPPPPPAAPPTYVDRDIQGAYDSDKKRQRAAAGRGGTILTGPSGLSGTGNIGKTVLGG
jgi:hypothetical protein